MNTVTPANRQMGEYEAALLARVIDAKRRLRCPLVSPIRAPRADIPRPPVEVADTAVEVFAPVVELTPGNTSRSVIAYVCWKHNITREELLSGRRAGPRIAPARQEAMYLMRHNVLVAGRPISLPEIGRRLGGLDHTSALYGIRAHEARMKETA